jgi:hypothetical protein
MGDIDHISFNNFTNNIQIFSLYSEMLYRHKIREVDLKRLGLTVVIVFDIFQEKRQENKK